MLTGVTLLSIHDPVLVAEEYALLDHLSEGLVDLVIAKGNHAPHFALFGLDPEKQWDVLAEKYELLRRPWSKSVTWSGQYRDAITAVTTQPRPFQEHIRVWHGSATSRNSTELAARFGDPLYSANGSFRTPVYQELIDHYRERWAHYGHGGDPVVAASFPAVLIRSNSQDAVEAYRPFWNAQRETPPPGTTTRRSGNLRSSSSRARRSSAARSRCSTKSTGSPRPTASSSPASASTRCRGTGRTSSSNGSPPASSLSCAAATPTRCGTYGPVRRRAGVVEAIDS